MLSAAYCNHISQAPLPTHNKKTTSYFYHVISFIYPKVIRSP
jgi:hypothetical protein